MGDKMYKLFNSIYNSIRGVKRMKKTYTIIIHKEEDGFWGECLEIEGCFAQAKTTEELIKMMTKAIHLYFNSDENIDKNENDIKVEVSYA